MIPKVLGLGNGVSAQKWAATLEGQATYFGAPVLPVRVPLSRALTLGSILRKFSAMGRVKLDIKKIQNRSNRQVTYSKRRNGLLKKAFELSVLCDIDIAVIMFSPSGKLTEFCRDDRIEEVITRFAHTPQHERTKRKFENMEYLNKVVQKLTDERGLEAPRVGAADLQQEVQELKSQLDKTLVERNFFEQKARLFEGNEYINSFNAPAQLANIRSSLVQAMEKVEERMGQLEIQLGPVVKQNTVQQTSFDMLSGIPARESTEGLNVGSTPGSAQAMHMHMHNWGGVHNLDNATAIMANSQMREPSGADYHGNSSFYPRRSNMEQYHGRALDVGAGPLGQNGDFNNFHGTKMEVRAGPGGQSTEFNPYGTKVEENTTQFAYGSGVQPQISSLPNQGRQGQLHNEDRNYSLYSASLPNQGRQGQLHNEDRNYSLYSASLRHFLL